jgi:parallel beta-helix repeat protein
MDSGERSRPMIRSVMGCAAGVLALLATACSDRDGLLVDDPLLTVGPTSSYDFPSIQAAVESAGPGATVEVAPGRYVEQVVITQSVRLVGAGSLVELPAGKDATEGVIEVRGGADITIAGFTVRGIGDGIGIRDAGDVVVEAVDASECGNDGIHVEASTAVVVRSSTITANGQDGVEIDSCGDCVLEDSTVTANGDDGIFVGSSPGTEILQNTVTGNVGTGIRLLDSPLSVLLDNVVSGNGRDIEID